jgi:hypothetical protein
MLENKNYIFTLPIALIGLLINDIYLLNLQVSNKLEILKDQSLFVK